MNKMIYFITEQFNGFVDFYIDSDVNGVKFFDYGGEIIIFEDGAGIDSIYPPFNVTYDEVDDQTIVHLQNSLNTQ